MADDDSEGRVTLAVGLKYGLGFIALGVAIFLVLTLMEGGRGGRVHWLIAAIYYVGGKWAVAGILWLGGLVFIAAGVRTHIRERD